MDLTTVTHVQPLTERIEGGVTRLDGVGEWRPGDAWLGGGTWLYSQPQPGLRRLLDLTTLGWPPLTVHPRGLLEVAATCPIADLARFVPPPGWPAAALLRQAARWLLMSFKVWNTATVGGNLALALPAGAMTSLAAGLGAICEIRHHEGAARFVAAADPMALRPGEYLRSIRFSGDALRGRVAARQQSLTTYGRSAVLVVGQVPESGGFALTVTASTVRPVRLEFPAVPGPAGLARALTERLTDDLWHDDVHGDRDWRQYLTFALAEQVRVDLAGPGPVLPGSVLPGPAGRA